MDCRPIRNGFFTNSPQIRHLPCSYGFYGQGISLWNLWKAEVVPLAGRDQPKVRVVAETGALRAERTFFQ